MVYLGQILHTYTFEHCPATGMQNGDEALPSIIPAGGGHTVKVLTTLELHDIFDQILHTYITTFSRHWYAKR